MYPLFGIIRLHLDILLPSLLMLAYVSCFYVFYHEQQGSGLVPMLVASEDCLIVQPNL